MDGRCSEILSAATVTNNLPGHAYNIFYHTVSPGRQVFLLPGDLPTGPYYAGYKAGACTVV